MACMVRIALKSPFEELSSPALNVPPHDPCSEAVNQPATSPALLVNAKPPCVNVNTEPFCDAVAASTVVDTSDPAREQDQIARVQSPLNAFTKESVDIPPEERLAREQATVHATTVSIQKAPSWKDFWGLRKPCTKASSTSRSWHHPFQTPVTSSRLPPSVSTQPSDAESNTEVSSLQTSSTLPLSSFASSRTSVDTLAVTRQLQSSDVSLWCEAQSLYIGDAVMLPVPATIEIEWRQNVRARLLSDLRPVLQRLPRSLSREKTIVEAELRMVGKANHSLGTVDLQPTILIRCGGRRCRRVVSDAIEALRYLQFLGKDQVIVHQKAPRLASGQHDIATCATTEEEVEKEGSEEGDTKKDDDRQNKYTLIARLERDSACGLPLINFSGDEPRESMVGGLIKVDGIVYGLATAHAVLQPDFDLSDHSESLSDQASDIESDSESDTEPVFYAIPEDVGTIEYDPIRIGPYSYGSLKNPSKAVNAYSVSQGTDFALMEMPDAYRDKPNLYHIIQPGTIRTRSIVISNAIPAESARSQVLVICSPTDVRSATVLEGEHMFMDRTDVFSTRKLRTEHPLEQGTSGAWVVCGSKVLGMIIAVYDEEPYAHFLDMSTVFSDIRALLSTHDHVPQVSLAGLPLCRAESDVSSILPIVEETDRIDPECLVSGDNDFDTVRQSVTKNSPVDFEDHNVTRTFPSIFNRIWFRLKSNFTRPYGMINADKNIGMIATGEDFLREKDMARPFEIDKKLFLVMLLTSFCVHLDASMTLFIAPTVSDELRACEHLGIYVGIYKLLAFTMQSPWVKLYENWDLHWVLILATSLFEAGLVCSALARISIWFAVGRGVSGIGVAGITAYLSHSHDIWPSLFGLTQTTKGRRLLLATVEFLAYLVGPFVAAVQLPDSALWRWCFRISAISVGVLMCFVLILTYTASRSSKSIRPRRLLYRDTVQGYYDLLLFPAGSLMCFFAVTIGPIIEWRKSSLPVTICLAMLVLLIEMIRSALREDTCHNTKGLIQQKEPYQQLSMYEQWEMDGTRAKRPFWKTLAKVASTVCTSLCYTSAGALQLFLPFWLQATKGTDTVKPMLLYLAYSVPAKLPRLIAADYGTTQIAFHACLLSVTTVGSGLLTTLSPTSATWYIILAQLLAGAGNGPTGLTRNFECHQVTTSQYFEVVGVAIGQAVLMLVLGRGIRGSVTDSKIIHPVSSAPEDGNSALTRTFFVPTVASGVSVLLVLIVFVYVRLEWRRERRERSMMVDLNRRRVQEYQIGQWEVY